VKPSIPASLATMNSRRENSHRLFRRRYPVIYCAVLGLLAAGWLTAQEPAAPRLPANLQWETNHEDPIFASDQALRGGRFRAFMLSFPLTLRRVGPDSNGAFAGFLRANHLGLVSVHPNTLKPIPELATHWAFGEDGKTVYYKLDPDARWSDGKPVTADDYLYTRTFMRSKEIVAPWYNNHFSKVIVKVIKFDNHTIAIEGATSKPREELLYEYGINPTPAHFHHLDDRWIRDYNWKIEPNTGPYQICDIRKGKHIEFCRKDNWWADQRHYQRFRYNPDRVRVKVIRDLNIAYQHFIKGDLDTFNLVMPRFWHKKATGRAYDQGYVGKIKFYNEVPQPAYGIYLNEDDPLFEDERIRFAFAHAMNIDKVLKTVLRGDYERLQTMNEGYGDYSNQTIKAREFDLARANELFKDTGWHERGPDGIRHKNSERLSVRITYVTAEHTPRLVVLKEEALKAGIELKLQLLDPSAGFKQILEKKHQAAWMGWAGGGLSPRYWQFFHSSNAHIAQTNNITNTDDAKMDALIDAYRDAREKSERIRLAHALEQKVFDFGSVVPTYKVPYTREAFWRWIVLPADMGTRSSSTLYSPFGSTGGLFWIDENIKKQVAQARPGNQAFPPIYIENTDWKAPKNSEQEE
jgi:microcin C transport system substrate-binding protein